MLTSKIIGRCQHLQQLDLREFKGRVFFVTDLHGCYDVLHDELRAVSFDSTHDILVVGGDWTDRGAYSKYVLDYICEPWVFSVAGNHCQMFVDGFDSHWNPNNRSVMCLAAHGGEWIETLTNIEKILIADVFRGLPLAIELLLPNDVKVGVVHAEVPYNDWDKMVDISKLELDMDGKATLQWARRWYTSKFNGKVKGVDYVLCGHTSTDSEGVEIYGNMVFCDGGTPWSGKMNLVEINNELLEKVNDRNS